MNKLPMFKLWRVGKEPTGLIIIYPRQRGAETVEFALTALPFLVVFFSFLIAGFIMYTQISVAYLAREGVMWAIKRGNDAATAEAPDPVRPDAPATVNTIRDFVRGVGLLKPSQSILVSACWGVTCNNDTQCGSLSEGENNNPGCSVRVTVSYTYDPPLAEYIWPGGITSSSTAQGVILY